MKLRQALGRFGGVPLDLHPAWMRVHYGARCIGMDMIAHCTDPHERTLPVEADWKESVCSLLTIGGKDRRNAKANLDALLEAGLLTLSEGSVRVELAPAVLQPRAGRALDVSRECAERVPKTTQVPENSLSDSLDRQRDKTEEREKRERAPTRAKVLERAPIGEPPPELPPVDPPLARTIVSAHAAEYVKRMNGARAMEDCRSALRVAEWCTQNAAAYRLSERELALRVVAGLFASPRAGAQRWKLSWAANDPAEYAGLPPGVVISSTPEQSPREKLQAAREAARAAQIDFNRLDQAPWFDKEESTYPAALEAARQRLATANQALADLNSDQRVRAVAS